MKSSFSPAGWRKLERERKKRERDRLRERGLRPRQIWATDGAWDELRPWLAALGITGARGKALKSESQIDESDVGASRVKEQGVSCSQRP